MLTPGKLYKLTWIHPGIPGITAPRSISAQLVKKIEKRLLTLSPRVYQDVPLDSTMMCCYTNLELKISESDPAYCKYNIFLYEENLVSVWNRATSFYFEGVA